MQAVITADIVNSTLLLPKEFQALTAYIKAQYQSPNLIEFYRGDSFQVLVQDSQEAFRYMVFCRLQAISYSEANRIDIRQSISLGKVEQKVPHLGSHVDELFVSSGRTFDQLNGQNSGQNLLITCGVKEFDYSFDLIARYTDSLLSQITGKQALVIYHLLSGKNQKEVAAILKKTGATIHQQVRAARFDELAYLISRYEELTDALKHHGK